MTSSAPPSGLATAASDPSLAAAAWGAVTVEILLAALLVAAIVVLIRLRRSSGSSEETVVQRLDPAALEDSLRSGDIPPAPDMIDLRDGISGADNAAGAIAGDATEGTTVGAKRRPAASTSDLMVGTRDVIRIDIDLTASESIDRQQSIAGDSDLASPARSHHHHH